MGVFAEFERAMIRERVMAGLKRVKANGTTLGRPRIDEAAKTAARKALRSGKGIIKVVKEIGSASGRYIGRSDLTGEGLAAPRQ
jgi:DNA invertase Pin-like site-specific DNA recombinase